MSNNIDISPILPILYIIDIVGGDIMKLENS